MRGNRYHIIIDPLADCVRDGSTPCAARRPPQTDAQEAMGDSDEESNVDCAICLLSGPAICTPLRITDCGHTFCIRCLAEYSAMLPQGSPVMKPPSAIADRALTAPSIFRTSRPLVLDSLGLTV